MCPRDSDTGGQQDACVQRRDAPSAHRRELVRAGHGIVRHRYRTLRSGGRPGGIETRPKQIGRTEPVDRELAHVKQRAEKNGEEYYFRKDEPRHAPAERSVDLLVVHAAFALADHLTEPTRHHRHDDDAAEPHQPRAGTNSIKCQHGTQGQREQPGRGNDRPRTRVGQVVATVCRCHCVILSSQDIQNISQLLPPAAPWARASCAASGAESPPYFCADTLSTLKNEYAKVMVVTSGATSGNTVNCTGISRDSPGFSSWRVKQKHSIFLKYGAARFGATLGTAWPINLWSVVLRT